MNYWLEYQIPANAEGWPKSNHTRTEDKENVQNKCPSATPGLKSINELLVTPMGTRWYFSWKFWCHEQWEYERPKNSLVTWKYGTKPLNSFPTNNEVIHCGEVRLWTAEGQVRKHQKGNYNLQFRLQQTINKSKKKLFVTTILNYMTNEERLVELEAALIKVKWDYWGSDVGREGCSKKIRELFLLSIK